jgi:hypothetical protein
MSEDVAVTSSLAPNDGTPATAEATAAATVPDSNTTVEGDKPPLSKSQLKKLAKGKGVSASTAEKDCKSVLFQEKWD